MQSIITAYVTHILCMLWLKKKKLELTVEKNMQKKF